MKSKIITFQNKVLRALANEIDDFYLAGGTALSLYYFNHRESLDLDFFTQSFNKIRIFEAIKILSVAMKKDIKLIEEQDRKDVVKMLVYSLCIDKKNYLKIDFVEDYLERIKPCKSINGIKVLSIEDIYIRKIYAVAGSYQIEDSIGRRVSKGHRQEAKDFYDLYYLSHVFMNLADFSFKYGNDLTREAIIRWFRTYNRFNIKTELMELRIKKEVDYKNMEHHFKKEVDKIIEKEVDFI